MKSTSSATPSTTATPATPTTIQSVCESNAGSVSLDLETTIRFQDEFAARGPSFFVNLYEAGNLHFNERLVCVLSHTISAGEFINFITTAVAGRSEVGQWELDKLTREVASLTSMYAATTREMEKALEREEALEAELTETKRRLAATAESDARLAGKANHLSNVLGGAQSRIAALDAAVVKLGGNPYAL